jgi:hypothetical protein
MSIFAQMDAASPRVAPRLPVFAYRMRWKRRRLLLRAWRFRHQLQRLRVDSARIEAAPILAFSTLRNERARLPHFLDHNRALGVGHFLIVDNDSDDGTQEFLRGHADVSFWRAGGSYKQARFGVDWLTCLQFRFGHGKWCLTLDADELLVLPGGRDLRQLTAHLDATGRRAFGALMLDLFPKGTVTAGTFAPGDDPRDHLPWFDPRGYRARRHAVFDNLWIEGGHATGSSSPISLIARRRCPRPRSSSGAGVLPMSPRPTRPCRCTSTACSRPVGRPVFCCTASSCPTSPRNRPRSCTGASISKMPTSTPPITRA